MQSAQVQKSPRLDYQKSKKLYQTLDFEEAELATMIFNADQIRKNNQLEMSDNGISEKIGEESCIGDGDAGIDGDGEISDKLGEQLNTKMKINSENIKSPLLGMRNIVQRPGLDLEPLRTVQIYPRLPSIDEILSERGMTKKKLGKIIDKAA
jgi:hypothetical protein